MNCNLRRCWCSSLISINRKNKKSEALTLATGPGSIGTGIACGFAGACGHSAGRLLAFGFLGN